MIKPTEEMITTAMDTAVFEAARGASARHATRRALTAALALVERDWNMQPNPNARPATQGGRLVTGVAYCGACAQVEGDPHAKWCERLDGPGGNAGSNSGGEVNG